MPEHEDEQKRLEDEIFAWAKEYAEEHGWSLNYIDKQLKAVIRGLARNYSRHGERYCPCRIRSGDPDSDREIICPCIYHDEEIATQGHCHCNLFFDDKFFEELMNRVEVPEPDHPIIENNHVDENGNGK